LGSSLLQIITIDNEMLILNFKKSSIQMRILNDIACNLNRIQISLIQLKKNEIQIDAKTIENLLIVFIICDYGV
jgi:hypothetical protein